MASSPIRIVVMGVRDPLNAQDASAPALVATGEFVVEGARLTPFADGERETA